jgi:hypothetical protein
MYCLRNKIVCFCGLVVLLILPACQQNKTVSKLYNIDSLVNEQVKYLTARQAKLHKVATVGSVNDDSTYIPKDSARWNAELEIFRSLDAINKPVNQSNYLVDDNLFDPSSNLTVKAFSALTDLPVKYVRVFYQSALQKPRKIEALYDDKNALYKSGRVLTMNFQQIDNKTILTSYSIKGGQKMILSDTIGFEINGRVIVN